MPDPRIPLAMSEWVALADRVLEVLADVGPGFDVGRDLAGVPELGLVNAGHTLRRDLGQLALGLVTLGS